MKNDPFLDISRFNFHNTALVVRYLVSLKSYNECILTVYGELETCVYIVDNIFAFFVGISSTTSKKTL